MMSDLYYLNDREVTLDKSPNFYTKSIMINT